MNWNLTLADGSVRDVIYWPELKSLDDFPRIRGGNPLLFPFCGRTFDGGEQGFWRAADGVRRPMPQHGIARQADFKVVRLDARGFAAQLVPDDEARAAYPYDYEFTVTYRFDPVALHCEFSLKNLGAEAIPWCAGHHFYFTVPWTEGTARGDYLIRIPATQYRRQDASGQLVAWPKLRAEESLGNPGLIDTFHTGLRGADAVFGEKGRPGDVVVRLGAANVPPAGATFVTWTADDAAPFYCVEPWMGPPNAPEHKLGLQWVLPHETATFAVSVKVK
jgi:galactose mutarotase-like enzyme